MGPKSGTEAEKVPALAQLDADLRLTAALLRQRAPSFALSDVEHRLLRIANEMFCNCVVMARCKESGPPREINAAVIVEAAGWALAAAIEIEGPLREIRERIEGRK